MSFSFAPDSCLSLYEDLSTRKVFYVCVKSEQDPSFEVRTTCPQTHLLYHPSSGAGEPHHSRFSRLYTNVEWVGGALASLLRNGARIAPQKWHMDPLYFSSERVSGSGSGSGPRFFKFFIRGLWELWLES
jgi:hypothetical protein